MSEGQTGRSPGDPGWSERYAETGGWPPPTPDQPGAPSPDPTAAAPYDPPTDGPPYAAGPADGPPYAAAGSPYPTGPETGGYPAGAPWAPGDSAYGRLAGSAGGPDVAPGAPPDPQRRPTRRPARFQTGGTPVTIGLIVTCVLAYLLQQADPTITYRFGLLPVAVLEDGEWYRVITSAFLHAGLLHLATNMLSLYIVGAPLERVLKTSRYLTVYLLSALGGSFLSLWLSPEYTVGVGASGAIFGLFGALVVLRRQVGAEAGGLAVLIGINLVISFTVPNIAWQAHIGGLITGALVALALLPTLRARRR